MFLAHTTITQAPEVAAAVVGACRIGDSWGSDFQPRFLGLLFRELIGVDIDFTAIKGINVQEAAQSFPDPLQRLELIELMVLAEMMLNPVPSQLEASVEPDPELAAQWRSLAELPNDTLGAAVWQHYQRHGFTTPGELGGANAALAHHDWLHVLGNYDVDVIGEVENAAFGAASSSVTGATLWFLGVMAMYEGGLFDSVVIGSHPHQISAPGMCERVIHALKRGPAHAGRIY